MNLKQTAKNNMYKAVATFFENNTTAFAGFSRAQTEIVTFGKHNQSINGFINQQNGTSKGSTGQKEALFTAMVQLIVKSSRKALVYATDQEDAAMQALFNVQQSTFDKTTETKALAIVENVYSGLLSLNGKLDDYRVTAADIMAIGTAIDNFKSAEGMPQNARAAVDVGTRGIETTMPLIDKSLDILDDLIVHGMDDEPNLVNAYRKVRKVTETGTRHTGLVVTINDAASGKGIEGATMLVQELNKKATSDMLGVADIESMKPGMYHIIFSADGYAPQTQILKIEQGKTLDEEVKMVRE